MFNLKELEQLRNEEEIFNYFAKKGLKVNLQQIEALKQTYENLEYLEYSENELTLKQLEDVAGGVLFDVVEHDGANGAVKHTIYSTLKGCKRQSTGLEYAKQLLGTEYEKHKDMLETLSDSSKILVIRLKQDGALEKVEKKSCEELCNTCSSVSSQFSTLSEGNENAFEKAQIESANVTLTSAEDSISALFSPDYYRQQNQTPEGSRSLSPTVHGNNPSQPLLGSSGEIPHNAVSSDQTAKASASNISGCELAGKILLAFVSVVGVSALYGGGTYLLNRYLPQLVNPANSQQQSGDGDNS